MPREQYSKGSHYFVAGSLGHIEGVTLTATSDNQAKLHYVGGLPYALPPTGRFRFCRPRPLPEGYRYGTKVTPGRFTNKTAYCPQPHRGGQIDTAEFDEDCLQLNIYMPAQAPPSGGWPVYATTLEITSLAFPHADGLTASSTYTVDSCNGAAQTTNPKPLLRSSPRLDFRPSSLRQPIDSTCSDLSLARSCGRRHQNRAKSPATSAFGTRGRRWSGQRRTLVTLEAMLQTSP